MHESKFFKNCGTFCFDLYWKYHNFERNEIRATVFLKWTDFSFVCEIEPHITFTIKFHVSATIIGKWEIKLVDKIDPFYETLKEIQIGAELVLFDGK